MDGARVEVREKMGEADNTPAFSCPMKRLGILFDRNKNFFLKRIKEKPANKKILFK